MPDGSKDQKPREKPWLLVLSAIRTLSELLRWFII